MLVYWFFILTIRIKTNTINDIICIVKYKHVNVKGYA